MHCFGKQESGAEVKPLNTERGLLQFFSLFLCSPDISCGRKFSPFAGAALWSEASTAHAREVPVAAQCFGDLEGEGAW